MCLLSRPSSRSLSPSKLSPLYFCHKFHLTYRLKYNTIAYIETECNYSGVTNIIVLIWLLEFNQRFVPVWRLEAQQLDSWNSHFM